MSDLLPCPFCGEQHQLVIDTYDVTACGTEQKTVIECLECGTRSRPYSTREDAINAWNTRAQPTYNPATHILIAREDVPDDLGGALEDSGDPSFGIFISRLYRRKPREVRQFLTIRKAALLAEKGE